MLAYPSIPSWRDVSKGLPCLAFYKYDGSNLRFEWNPKTGWCKFGTRTQLFDKHTELYSQALPLFTEEMAEDIVVRVNKWNKRKVERITAFAEFFGNASFAGSHILEEPKNLKLFDISVFKKGFIQARDFIDCFEDCNYVAELIYEGNMNQSFIDDVRNGVYSNLIEGVVCKGKNWNAKIKTLAYLDKLKTYKGDKWIDFAE